MTLTFKILCWYVSSKIILKSKSFDLNQTDNSFDLNQTYKTIIIIDSVNAEKLCL
jgi:hypothetical protein